MLGETVIVIGGKQPSLPLKCQVVGLLVLVIHISPVAFNVAVEGFLDEPGKLGILARQVVYSSTGDNLPCVKNGVDYEQCVYGLYLLFSGMVTPSNFGLWLLVLESGYVQAGVVRPEVIYRVLPEAVTEVQ